MEEDNIVVKNLRKWLKMTTAGIFQIRVSKIKIGKSGGAEATARQHRNIERKRPPMQS